MYYSQDGQDRYLEENIFKGFKNGYFVDVGAYDGVTYNNTLYFEKNNNWSGINIEPMPNIYEKLQLMRPNCKNLNVAVSNKDGAAEFIYNNEYTDMLSGLKENYDIRHLHRLFNENKTHNSKSSIIEVNTLKLETISDTYNIKHIHYLSIDVEGAEFDVIKSINFDKVFIDVIGFENNYIDKSLPIIEYLENKGYIFLKASLDIFMIHKDSQFNKNR